jgi:hypothetical protein
MSVWSGLRALFSDPKPTKAVARPHKKTALSPAARAALIKDAMEAHRVGRTHVRDVLERELDALRAKVPDPARDPAASQRLLAADQTNGTMKKLMGSDLKRVLMLIGMRQRLRDEAPAAPKTARTESRAKPKR